jgi:hypothetical protein
MRFWGTRRKQAVYSLLLAEVAGKEAVRWAEEVVGAAWLETLSDAERQAAFAQRVCTHMRDTAYEVFRSAETSRDSEQIEASHRELTASQQALTRVRDQHDGMRRFAGRQRMAWATAARDRTKEALADRERLVRAARAAGVRAEPLLGHGG